MWVPFGVSCQDLEMLGAHLPSISISISKKFYPSFKLQVTSHLYHKACTDHPQLLQCNVLLACFIHKRFSDILGARHHDGNKNTDMKRPLPQAYKPEKSHRNNHPQPISTFCWLYIQIIFQI